MIIMRKKELNNLVKLVKNEKKKNGSDYNGITFNPTLEECEYLYSKGVTSTKSLSKRLMLVFDYSEVPYTFYDTTNHSVEI